MINGGFLLFSAVVLTVLVTKIHRKEQENKIEKLDGFSVFCEGEEISALFLEDDKLWVGGRDGVKRIDTGSGELIDYVADDLELIYAAQICRAQDGSIWIGHNAGVTILSTDGVRYDFGEPDITGGRVNTILTVDEGVMIGTMQGATLFGCGDGKWEPVEKYTSKNGLLVDPVNVLMQDAGALWFGSYLNNKPGGISIQVQDGWQYLTIKDGLAHPYINAILAVEDGVLVGTGQMMAGGLSLLQKADGGFKVMDTFGVADRIPGEKVRWLYQDEAGHLWITTESDGLLVCPDSRLTHPIKGILLQEEMGLSDNEIKRIVESDNYYWLAGRYGLTRIDKSAIETLLEEEEFNGK